MTVELKTLLLMTMRAANTCLGMILIMGNLGPALAQIRVGGVRIPGPREVVEQTQQQAERVVETVQPNAGRVPSTPLSVPSAVTNTVQLMGGPVTIDTGHFVPGSVGNVLQGNVPLGPLSGPVNDALNQGKGLLGDVGGQLPIGGFPGLGGGMPGGLPNPFGGGGFQTPFQLPFPLPGPNPFEFGSALSDLLKIAGSINASVEKIGSASDQMSATMKTLTPTTDQTLKEAGTALKDFNARTKSLIENADAVVLETKGAITELRPKLVLAIDSFSSALAATGWAVFGIVVMIILFLALLNALLAAKVSQAWGARKKE